MLLAIDIGNTNTVFGLYSHHGLEENWRVTSAITKTPDEYAVLLSNLLAGTGYGMREITAVIISSTVPPLVDVWSKLADKYLKLEPIIITVNNQNYINILLDNPEEIGPDRIVNGIAGRHKYGNSLIIVDMGTATTFDCISQNGEFLGGVIAPGIGVSANALFAQTSRLPKVEFKCPPHVLGTNTIHALQSGLIYGFAGQIDGIVRRLKEEMSGKVTVVATGGMARVIAEASTKIEHIDSFLTLDGLNLIYNMMHETNK